LFYEKKKVKNLQDIIVVQMYEKNSNGQSWVFLYGTKDDVT
jgi:hypothetical protein